MRTSTELAIDALSHLFRKTETIHNKPLDTYSLTHMKNYQENSNHHQYIDMSSQI